MKIAALLTHYKTPYQKKVRTSAVDWWRTVNPLTHLAKNSEYEVDFIINFDKPFEEATADDFEKLTKYDLIHFSYFDNPISFSYLKALEKRGIPHVCDFDDNIISLSEHNPVKKQYDSDENAYTTLLVEIADSQNLCVTNHNLKNAYEETLRKKKTFVIPNYIDLEVYKYQDHQEDDVITIGYQGGVTHQADMFHSPFWGAMSYIQAKYEGKVVFSICGFLPDDKYFHFKQSEHLDGKSDFYEWVKNWKFWTPHIDIGVAPLENTQFNSCKSSIKVQEYAAAKIPVVCSNVGAYKDLKHVLKADSARDWIDHLESLIESETKRRKLGEDLYTYVQAEHNIEHKWTKYKKMYDKILKTSSKKTKTGVVSEFSGGIQAQKHNIVIKKHMDHPIEAMDGEDGLLAQVEGCKQLKSKYWLASGNLLGLYRDGGLIPHDTDIDVEVLCSFDSVPKIELEGFDPFVSVLWKEYPMQTAFVHKKTGVIFDIYYFYKKGEYAYNFNMEGCIKMPLKFVNNLDEFIFDGVRYPIPQDVEKYFEWRFGKDWKTPKKKKIAWQEEAAHLMRWK